MGFRFSYLCDLLSKLESNRTLKASSSARSKDVDSRTVINWFNNYEKRIYDKNTDLLALLSCLFPEKRIDRVFWLQDASLARVIARCLLLGISRREQLDRWTVGGGEDLGQCVENVMRQAENHVAPGQEVTTEEIDAALNKIASRCRFSGPRVRRQYTAVDVEETLGNLYRRLNSRDAKWLTRMILKSYTPAMLPVSVVLRNFHFLLPHLLLFQDCFDAAVSLLISTPLSHFPPRPEPGAARTLSAKALGYLTPRIGIKVGRPEFYKARSIKHCCKMIGRRRMSLERKYDGEYCQIHIDLSKPYNWVQIFSKSGKDSTADRLGIRDVLREALKIDRPDCKFSQYCVLEGELLVWSDNDQRILDFHKLRKFITRSGILIGADNDSQPKSYEHLMIMFFDILLVDDDICLTKPHRKRRLLLKETVNSIPGRSGIVEQRVIDFTRPGAQNELERVFSRSIVERWEGYVLKGCDEPYFAILSPCVDDYYCRWIKLKKDYIPGLGDTADFALIGGRYDSKDAAALRHIGKLSWTRFYVGCLENKDAVLKANSRPRFRVVDAIDRYGLSAKNMQLLNQSGQFCSCSPGSNMPFDVHNGCSGFPDMDVVFRTPFVVEMLGSGFEKPPNSQYYTLRFPRVLKIHFDRTYEEAISFSELQLLADKARSVPAEELAEELALWTERIKAANGGPEYITDESLSNTAASSASFPGTTRKVAASVNEQTPREASTNVISRTNTCTQQFPTQSSHSSKSVSGKRHHQPPEGLASLRSPKKYKASHNPTGDIPIFMDNPKWLPFTSPGQDNPNRTLRDIENKSFHRDTIAITMAPTSNSVTDPSVQNENSTGDVSWKAGPPHNREAAEVQRNGSGPHGEIRCATTGSAIDNAAALTELSKPQRISLRSPLVTVPVYLGHFFFKPHESAETVERFFRAQAREFTFTVCHFVKELGFPTCRSALRDSNPNAISQDIALGIVLVDRRSPVPTVANDILEVGNEVSNTISSSRPGLPSKGKIFFLDWHILQIGTGVEDRNFCFKSTWAQIAEYHFHACIQWGYGLLQEEKGKRNAETMRLPSDNRSDSNNGYDDKRGGTDVMTSWDSRDLEILGEFASVQPLVHVSGEEFEDTGMYA